jgi:hypothetical protein
MLKTKRSPLTFTVDKVSEVAAEAVERALPANAKTPKRKNPKSPAYREGRQFIAAHVVTDAAKQFKLLAVQQDKDVQELLVEAINDLFAKNGLSRIA